MKALATSLLGTLLVVGSGALQVANARASQSTGVLFENVRIFNGTSDRLSAASNVLEMVTHGNAQLLALSGNRNPYPGTLGVVKEGALADLLLVDGDPLANLELLKDPETNFVAIVKDGKLFENSAR